MPSHSRNWADLGAGTGMFTEALKALLPSGKIFAVDKNPHVLWSLAGGSQVEIVVQEADFTKPMELPELDGIVMANALHYTPRPSAVLQQMMQYLRPGGHFILVEYETEQARPPWIPYPLPFRKFTRICEEAGLTKPVELHQVPAAYGHQHIYSALLQKSSTAPRV